MFGGEAASPGQGGASITTGNGDNTITITANGVGAIGMEGRSVHYGQSASITTGDGNNTITIAATAAQGHAYGMLGQDGAAFIATGDGINTINIEVNAFNTPSSSTGSTLATGMQRAAIRKTEGTTGNGNDTIIIKTNANGDRGNGNLTYAQAVGVYQSTINTGNGTGGDLIDILAEATGNEAHAYGVTAKTPDNTTRASSSINTGGGENSITITATAIGAKSTAYGVEGSTIQTGADNDSITITATATGGDGSAYGVQGSTITTGDGSDTVYIEAVGSTQSVALSNAVIGLGNTANQADADLAGAGDVNQLDIIGDVVESSKIFGTAGVDKITINGKLENSIIDTGAGNDEVWIDDDIFGGIIDLGTGDDFLMLRGAHWSGLDLEGGDNEDIVQAGTQAFNEGDGKAHLGDILGLTSTNLDNLDDDTNHIHGFEALLVELTSPDQSLDDLLGRFDQLSAMQGIGYTGDGAHGDNELVSLVLTGDVDSLVREYDGGTKLGVAQTVEIEGRAGELYDYYAITHHDNETNHDYEINLYILKHA
jgi:hypothetical protein